MFANLTLVQSAVASNYSLAKFICRVKHETFVEIGGAFSFESRELSHLITRNMSFLHAIVSSGKSTGKKARKSVHGIERTSCLCNNFIFPIFVYIFPTPIFRRPYYYCEFAKRSSIFSRKAHSHFRVLHRRIVSEDLRSVTKRYLRSLKSLDLLYKFLGNGE